MKKYFIVFIVLFTMMLIGCSTPGSAFAYPEPVIASEATTFVGVALRYAGARNAAVEKALAEGYTKIIAEAVEIEGVAGMTMVTLIMIK